MILKKLTKLGNHLDSLGLTKEADLLDAILLKMAEYMVEGKSPNITYSIFSNYIINSLSNYNQYYTVLQDLNYNNESFTQNMSFYIKLTPKEKMKSTEQYNKLFKDLPNTFLSYEGFKKAIDNFNIVFVDSSAEPDDRSADMNDNGVMRIFIENLDDKFNKGNTEGLIEEFFRKPRSTKTIYHEIAHYLNYIRSGVSAPGRSSGGLDKLTVNTPAYINNTEEIQARVMSELSDPNIEFYTELREAVERDDAKAYINFFLPKITYWDQYTPENKARVVNRIYKDFLDRQEARKKAKANPIEPTEVL
jgi:hypothetical protein